MKDRVHVPWKLIEHLSLMVKVLYCNAKQFRYVLIFLWTVQMKYMILFPISDTLAFRESLSSPRVQPFVRLLSPANALDLLYFNKRVSSSSYSHDAIMLIIVSRSEP